MKKSTIVASVLLGVTALSTTAFAGGQWTSWGTLTRLADYGTGMRVWGLNASSANSKAAKCAKTDVLRVDSALSSDKIDRINKVLMAGFLSGREVQVKIRHNKCLEDRPVIYAAAAK